MPLRGTAFLALIIISSLVLAVGSASAQLVGRVKDVIEPSGSSGEVDWTTSVITAVGIGAPPAQLANATQARAMAERAAQVSAYRNLLDAVKGVRINSTTTVENFIETSDVIRTDINGIIQGATMMDKKYMSDGSVEITVGMKLTGALADEFLTKTAPMTKSSVTFQAGATAPPADVDGQLYTGLIVDARGLDVRPAMAPKIMNEDGKEIYGSATISRDYAVREGMAEYLKDLNAAQTNPRVADKPLLVKAVKVSGGARADLTISNADATALQSAAQNLSMLEKCRVILVID